jgi:hypothetical protein
MRRMIRRFEVESLERKVLLSSDLAATQPVAAEIHRMSAGQADRTPIGTIEGQMSLAALSPLMESEGIAGFHFTDASASLRPYGKFTATGNSSNEQSFVCFEIALERKGYPGERMILLVAQTTTGVATLPAPDKFAVRTYRFVPSKPPVMAGHSTPLVADGTATLTFPAGSPVVGQTVPFTINFSGK